jgi:hypothetical protein
MAVDQPEARRDLSFPPRYGEQSEAILREVGYDEGQIVALRAAQVIAGPDVVAGAVRGQQPQAGA